MQVPGFTLSTWKLAALINRDLGIAPALYGYVSEQALHTAVWNVTKQAAAARDAGRTLNNPLETEPRLPRIPAYPASRPDYYYRTAVVVNSPHGVRESTALDIYSPYPLSRDELEQRAVEVAMNRLQQEGDTPGAQRVANLIPVSTVTVFTVQAGRR